MYSIRGLKARQIIDSNGKPTVECELKTVFGRFVASVPSGASTGEKEALELRNKKNKNFQDVGKAVQNINEILSVSLKKVDCRDQEKVDSILIKEDGTENKNKLGANALLAVSLANAKAGAVANKKELFEYLSELSGQKPLMPVPALNIINGGKHGGNDLAFQEYQLVPIKFKTFQEAFFAGVEIYQELKSNLEKDFGKQATNIGFEGGFAPNLSKVEEPIDEILKAIEGTGYEKEVSVAMDVAASEFAKKQDDGKITYAVEGHTLTGEKLLSEYEALLESYPLVSIEDPFDENDFESWKAMNSKLGKRVQILADDLTVSQEKFVKNAIDEKLANALLLKVNQVGTVTEAIFSAKLALSNNWNVQVSHRSGETNDSFIADLSVGLGCGQIKSGAPSRGERVVKYNRLLKIEEDFSLDFAASKAFNKRKE
jgi:enolase